ncbi:uncharacterized protein RHOBADRAFT_41553 [Rhodotorula graminis WP1]|uniref:Uncharacterized protein n=1 Tax=Rhodotorula graminis (strain WP1) TaxID=578459 RepID=A0A194SAE3_RHOGW|nr:uncharacterized protein RHOBADRAFT_41553 [Rhodotorula graminis WP1]KPV77559.1 hypothetical protein RHOBADRAFT_41553 [Rhodotorula graminis WP1]
MATYPSADVRSLSQTLSIPHAMHPGPPRRSYLEHSGALRKWREAAEAALADEWAAAAPEGRLMLKEGMQEVQDRLESGQIVYSLDLPNMHTMLTWLRYTHPEAGEDAVHRRTARTYVSRNQTFNSLGDVRHPRLGRRAQGRYGLEGDEWARRARRALRGVV